MAGNGKELLPMTIAPRGTRDGAALDRPHSKLFNHGPGSQRSGLWRLFILILVLSLAAMLPLNSGISRLRNPGVSSGPAVSRKGEDVISVVLPTFNERENISVLIFLLMETFSSLGERGEVVVVDDGSPDGTADAVKALQGVYGTDRVVLVQRQGKLGLGSAYRAGIHAAKGNWIVLMDADLSHHPKYLGAFLETQRTTGADIVTGTRYRTGGGVYGWTTSRRVVSNGANILAQTLLMPGVSDLTGSYRLYRRSALEPIMEAMVSKGYAFQMEIIVRARASGLWVAEVPIVFVDRLFGQSKLGAGEIAQYLSGMLRLLFTL